MEGFTEKLPVQRIRPLKREAPDERLAAFYERLLKIIKDPVFREGSMTALDSQFASLDPAARVQVRESRFGTIEDDDPFAAVERKRRP